MTKLSDGLTTPRRAQPKETNMSKTSTVKRRGRSLKRRGSAARTPGSIMAELLSKRAATGETDKNLETEFKASTINYFESRG